MAEMDLEIKLFQMVRRMLGKMVEEIPSGDFQRLPSGGGNSPNWLLGHLTVVNLMGVATLGGRPGGLKEMLPVYGPGSKPTEDTTTLSSKEELLETFNATADQFVALVEAATADQLNAQRESPILREVLPTNRDIVGHLLTTHLALHVGQLSAWRRGHGMDSILQF